MNGSEQKSSLRPEELPQMHWQLSIALLLIHRDGIEALQKFSDNHGYHEVAFWKSVEEYRTLCYKKKDSLTVVEKVRLTMTMSRQAQDLWNTFIQPHAPRRIEFEPAVLESIEEGMLAEKPKKSLFNTAQGFVLKDRILSVIASEFYSSKEYGVLLDQLMEHIVQKTKSSDRPVPLGMNDTLSNPLGAHIFRQYLMSTEVQLAHLLDFYLSVTTYKARALSPKERAQDGSFLCKRFLSPQSKHCVTIKNKARKYDTARELFKSLGIGEGVNAFDEAVRDAWKQLSHDVYPGFLQSTTYKSALDYMVDVQARRMLTRSPGFKYDVRTKSRFLAMLGTGQLFVKHNADRKPHRRFVQVTKDAHLIWYPFSNNSMPPSAVKSLVLNDVYAVRAGKETAVFKNAPMAGAIPTDMCFSVVTQARTLDLQCPTLDVRNEWLKALTWLVRTIKMSNVSQFSIDEGVTIDSLVNVASHSEGSVEPALEPEQEFRLFDNIDGPLNLFASNGTHHQKLDPMSVYTGIRVMPNGALERESEIGSVSGRTKKKTKTVKKKKKVKKSDKPKRTTSVLTKMKSKRGSFDDLSLQKKRVLKTAKPRSQTPPTKKTKSKSKSAKKSSKISQSSSVPAFHKALKKMKARRKSESKVPSTKLGLRSRSKSPFTKIKKKKSSTLTTPVKKIRRRSPGTPGLKKRVIKKKKATRSLSPLTRKAVAKRKPRMTSARSHRSDKSEKSVKSKSKRTRRKSSSSNSPTIPKSKSTDRSGFNLSLMDASRVQGQSEFAAASKFWHELLLAMDDANELQVALDRAEAMDADVDELSMELRALQKQRIQDDLFRDMHSLLEQDSTSDSGHFSQHSPHTNSGTTQASPTTQPNGTGHTNASTNGETAGTRVVLPSNTASLEGSQTLNSTGEQFFFTNGNTVSDLPGTVDYSLLPEGDERSELSYDSTVEPPATAREASKGILREIIQTRKVPPPRPSFPGTKIAGIEEEGDEHSLGIDADVDQLTLKPRKPESGSDSGSDWDSDSDDDVSNFTGEYTSFDSLEADPDFDPNELIREGFLDQRELSKFMGMTRWRRRWCVLTASCLTCYRDHKKEKQKLFVMLDDVAHVHIHADKNKGRRFEVMIDTINKIDRNSLVFVADSKTEAKEWAIALSRSVLQFSEHRDRTKMEWSHATSLRATFHSEASRNYARIARSLSSRKLSRSQTTHELALKQVPLPLIPRILNQKKGSQTSGFIANGSNPQRRRSDVSGKSGNSLSQFQRSELGIRPDKRTTITGRLLRSQSQQHIKLERKRHEDTHHPIDMKNSLLRPELSRKVTMLQHTFLRVVHESQYATKSPNLFRDLIISLVRTDFNILCFLYESVLFPLRKTVSFDITEMYDNPEVTDIPSPSFKTQQDEKDLLLLRRTSYLFVWTQECRKALLNILKHRHRGCISLALRLLYLGMQVQYEEKAPHTCENQEFYHSRYTVTQLTHDEGLSHFHHANLDHHTGARRHSVQHGSRLSRRNTKSDSKSRHSRSQPPRHHGLGPSSDRTLKKSPSKKSLKGSKKRTKSSDTLPRSVSTRSLRASKSKSNLRRSPPRKTTKAAGSSKRRGRSVQRAKSEKPIRKTTRSRSVQVGNKLRSNRIGDRDYIDTEDTEDELKSALLALDEKETKAKLKAKAKQKGNVELEETNVQKDVHCIACSTVSSSFLSTVAGHFSGDAFDSRVLNTLEFMLVTPVEDWFQAVSDMQLFGQNVRNPGVWRTFFVCLHDAPLPIRVKALTDATALMVKKMANRDSVLLQPNWQDWVVPLFEGIPVRRSERKGNEVQVYQYVMNILVMLSARAFFTVEPVHFEASFTTLIRLFQAFWADAADSQSYAHTLFCALLLDLKCMKDYFPTEDVDHHTWRNLSLLLNLVKIYVCATPAEDDGEEESDMAPLKKLSLSKTSLNLGGLALVKQLFSKAKSVLGPSPRSQSPSRTAGELVLTHHTNQHAVRFGDAVDFGIHIDHEGRVADLDLVLKAIDLLKCVAMGEDLDTYLSMQKKIGVKEKRHHKRLNSELLYFQDLYDLLDYFRIGSRHLTRAAVTSYTESFMTATDPKARHRILRSVCTDGDMPELIAKEKERQEAAKRKKDAEARAARMKEREARKHRQQNRPSLRRRVSRKAQLSATVAAKIHLSPRPTLEGPEMSLQDLHVEAE